MDNGDLQEMLGMALVAKEAGFTRIQVDPADFIEVAGQRNLLLGALKSAVESHELEDYPPAWVENAQQLIATATGAA